MACGAFIPNGDEAVAWRPGTGFADWQYLQMVGGFRVLCRYCAAVMTQHRLTALSKAVVSRDEGAFSLVRDSHLRWFLTSPPKPPYVAMWVASWRRPAHLFWQAVPTLDDEIMYIRYGPRTLYIRRKVLVEARLKALLASNIAREAGLHVKAWHPFQSLSRNLEGTAHGSIRWDIQRLALSGHSELQDILSFLLQLSDGELWALYVLAGDMPEKAEREPLNIL